MFNNNNNSNQIVIIHNNIINHNNIIMRAITGKPTELCKHINTDESDKEDDE